MTIDDIINIAANRFDVKPSQIRRIGRRQEVADARMAVCYLARKSLRITWKEISDAVRRRNHGAALHAYNRIQHLMTYNMNIKTRILACEIDIAKLLVEEQNKLAVVKQEGENNAKVL